MLNQIGGWGMGLIVPLISAAIAYSIADRPGFAPGLIVGFLCGQIHTGFIGGMLGGFLVGYTILLLKRYIRLPQSMQATHANHGVAGIKHHYRWAVNDDADW